MSAMMQSSSSAGLDGESGPLWFKPDKFLDPKFNPEAYVNDLKRYVPLDTLNATLTEHAEALRAGLVEVVNEDYDEFVSLSTKLVDVDGAVARLAAPLADVRARVEAARAAVAAQADALAEGLARRQAAAAARALLELAQDAVHAAAKVDKLLEELAADGAAGSGTNSEGDAAAREAAQEALEGRARLLDRACSEVSRLHFFAARGGELAVVRAMAPRVERAAAALRRELDAALAATLAAQNPAALGVLLHAYGSLGTPEAAEAVVRAQVVAPVVAAAVAGAREAAAARAAAAEPALPPPAPALAEVLPAVEVALREHTGPFLELALTTGGGAAAFDFLGGAVLPEALAAAEAACPGCYSPGLPDAFHANFLASAAFLAALEGLAATAAQVERLRGSPAAAAHRKKWNLAAYFSLRFQDVAGELEAALRGAGLAPAPAAAAAAQPGGPAFKFAATVATWRALEACVDPATFLAPLADRFLRLALQAVARAATWAEEGAAAADAAGAAPAQPAAAAEGGGDAQPAQQEGMDGGEGDGGKPWGAEATAEQLAELSQDFTALQAAVSAHLLPRFEALVAPTGAGAAAAEALAAAFDEAEARVGAAAGAVVSAAAARLVGRCCEALRQLRGIVATFRMTSRGAPTRPAQYAGAILAPLMQFLAGPGAGLGEPGRGALAAAVVAGVADRYRALAHDTLSTVRKTESSLRRLKSRKAPGAEAGGEASGSAAGAEQLGTDDLIALQLRLDFDEFGRRVAECGVDPGAVAAVAALRSVLEPPEDK